MHKKLTALLLTLALLIGIVTVAYAATLPDYKAYGLYVNGRTYYTIDYKTLKTKPSQLNLTVTVKVSRSPYAKTYENVPVVIQLKNSKGQVLQAWVGNVATKSVNYRQVTLPLKLENGTYYVVTYVNQKVTNGLTADQLKTLNSMRFLPERYSKNNYRYVKVIVKNVPIPPDNTKKVGLPPVTGMPKVDVKSRQDLINTAWEFYKTYIKPGPDLPWYVEANNNYQEYFVKKGNVPVPDYYLNNGIFYLFKANYTMNGRPLTDEEAKLATAYAANAVHYDFYMYNLDLLAHDKDHMFDVFGVTACEDYYVNRWNTNILSLEQINNKIKTIANSKASLVPYPYAASSEPETKAESIYKEVWLGTPVVRSFWYYPYELELRQKQIRLGDDTTLDYEYITDYELTPGKDQVKSITVKGFLKPHKVKIVFDQPVNVILDLTDYMAEKTWQELQTKPKSDVLVYKGTVYPWEEFGNQDPEVLVKVLETLKNNKVPVFVNYFTANTNDLSSNPHFDLKLAEYDKDHLTSINGRLFTAYDPVRNNTALSWTLNNNDAIYKDLQRMANAVTIKVGFNMTADGNYDTTFKTLHETSDLTGFPEYLLQPRYGVNYQQLVNSTHVIFKGRGGYAVPWYMEISYYWPY
ncbi:hypothetical protein [Carboxydothermus pertinax]|nr:hypothetical protein [Carboxydothermus pertinax]